MIKKPRGTRAAQKISAAERTAWNRYSIHDRAEVERRAALATRPGPVPLGLAGILVHIHAEHKRYVRHCGNQNKYSPHQGARECARRLRQAG